MFPPYMYNNITINNLTVINIKTKKQQSQSTAYIKSLCKQSNKSFDNPVTEN